MLENTAFGLRKSFFGALLGESPRGGIIGGYGGGRRRYSGLYKIDQHFWPEVDEDTLIRTVETLSWYAQETHGAG